MASMGVKGLMQGKNPLRHGRRSLLAVCYISTLEFEMLF